ncbi:MAG: DUF5989 family protein [Bacteroidia bacterium]
MFILITYFYQKENSMSFLRDLWKYFRSRNKWLLAPVVMLLLLIILLFIVGGSSSAGAFIYTLF